MRAGGPRRASVHMHLDNGMPFIETFLQCCMPSALYAPNGVCTTWMTCNRAHMSHNLSAQRVVA